MLVLCILAWNKRVKEKTEDIGGGDFNCESEKNVHLQWLKISMVNISSVSTRMYEQTAKQCFKMRYPSCVEMLKL